MLRYKTKTRPGLVALYDIRPGNGAGPFLQPRSPHGALELGPMYTTDRQTYQTKASLNASAPGRRHNNVDVNGMCTVLAVSPCFAMGINDYPGAPPLLGWRCGWPSTIPSQNNGISPWFLMDKHQTLWPRIADIINMISWPCPCVMVTGSARKIYPSPWGVIIQNIIVLISK